MNANTIAALCLAVIALAASPAHAQMNSAAPPILREVSISQNLNAQIPADLPFRDENGNPVRLGDYFGARPIVLSLVYFNCPALCTEVLNGELHTMQASSLTLGKDYDAVSVSFDPKDTPDVARAKRDVYTAQYRQFGRPAAAQNWHFLTGDAASINALTKAVGFHYAYDPAINQFAHAAAIVLLTPDGRVSRYFYGITYAARDFRLGLVDASSGKIGTLTDQAMLFCYQYDPETGKYGMVVMNIVRAGGALTLLALGIFMFVMFRRDRRNALASSAANSAARLS
ncbi:MAG: SCO family protein [Acidobacteriia bacterium]|nr:SCO family protein [Terriglobia bacterium]